MPTFRNRDRVGAVELGSECVVTSDQDRVGNRLKCRLVVRSAGSNRATKWWSDSSSAPGVSLGARQIGYENSQARYVGWVRDLANFVGG